MLGSGLLLQIICRSFNNGIAGHRFAPLAGKEDERTVRVFLADRLQELQAVHAGHLIVRDDAVDRLVGESFETVGRTRFRHGIDPLVLTFEKLRGHLREVRLVTYVKDADRVSHYPCLVLEPGKGEG